MSYNEELDSWTLDCGADMIEGKAVTGLRKAHDGSRHTRCDHAAVQARIVCTQCQLYHNNCSSFVSITSTSERESLQIM